MIKEKIERETHSEKDSWLSLEARMKAMDESGEVRASRNVLLLYFHGLVQLAGRTMISMQP